ncbi:MAG: SDR family oxidoreductase [Anaerolineales bacterium]|nr:SDR family oxidoreductase [Anaerolineales bacterium]
MGSTYVEPAGAAGDRTMSETELRTLPLRRLGQPEEVAEVIHFLCTNTSSYVTGTEIEVNAGEHV